MASTEYYIQNENELYFVTLTVIDWIDVFSRPIYRDIIIESLKYCQKEKGLEIYGYVIMSNHLHAILRAKAGFSLSGILRDFKKFTAKKIIAKIEEGPESRKEWMLDRFAFVGRQKGSLEGNKFWQDGNHAIECFSPSFTLEKLNYIHMNPVRNQLVAIPEAYIYSSALDYTGKRGLINVILLN